HSHLRRLIILSRHDHCCPYSIRIHPPPTSPLFPYTTLFRSFHPRGLRPAIINWEPTAAALIQWLHRDLLRTGDVETRRQCAADRSEEHTSELQSRVDLVCRLLLEKKNAVSDVRDRRTGQTRN